jgi:outer membrane protein OmpU
MKNIAWVLLSIVPVISYAQSSVTLFGSVGGGVRWTNGASGGSTAGFNNNVLYGNTFGFQGQEDLGSGVRAIFTLKGAFNSGTGALSRANTLFSQTADVGLAGKYGQLTFGRQLNPLEDFVISIDPSGAQGQVLALLPVLLWSGNYFTLDGRFNNTIKYSSDSRPFAVSVGYSPGGVAGNSRAGTNLSGTATYQRSIVSVGLAYSDTGSPDGSQTAQTLIAGGTLQIGPVRLYAGYATLNVSPSATTGSHRKDKIPDVGVVYQLSSFLQFSAAVYDDIASNLGNLNGASGRKLTGYAIAEYFLSKRTEIYAEVDRNSFTGAYRNDPVSISAIGLPSGGSGVTGASVGLMTRF